LDADYPSNRVSFARRNTGGQANTGREVILDSDGDGKISADVQVERLNLSAKGNDAVA
jgi:hypothetical protein